MLQHNIIEDITTVRKGLQGDKVCFFFVWKTYFGNKFIMCMSKELSESHPLELIVDQKLY